MEFVYFAGIWLAASFIKGISGMGAAMLAAPCMLLFMDVKLVVPVLCILGIVQSAGLVVQYRREFQLKDIFYVLIYAIPGIFLGTYALKILSSHVLEIFMAVFLICYALGSFVQKQKVQTKNNIAMTAACGFLAGFCGATTTFSGPALAMYALNERWKPERVLCFLGCSFVIINAISGTSQYFAGLYTKDLLGYLMVGVPASFIGMYFAAPFVKYISQNLFRKIILVIIGIAGIISLFRVIAHYSL